MLFHYCYFIVIAAFAVFGLNASTYNQQSPYQVLLNKPEYKELETKFEKIALENSLYNYDNGNYANNEIFKTWSSVADTTIGHQYVEEQRRYFLVNVMLHAQQNIDGLNILCNCFNNNLGSRQL